MNKNVIIPIVLGLIVTIIYILIYQTPLSIGILIMVILGMIILVQSKSKNNWGTMFIVGIVLAIIIVGLYIFLIFLSNDFLWLENILFWPNKNF